MKLTILINAYACGPNRGSEPGMAWNWCSSLAKHCELHIITEGEFRDDIETVLPTMEYGKNMHFYYLPVSEKIRKMCWNQGDWRFYHYYAQWQKRALVEAERIIASDHIDAVHQLNMIGFREPGLLWKIKDKPFIWGPIDAKATFPMQYTKEASLKTTLFLYLKNVITRYQLKHSDKVNNAKNKASVIIAASSNSMSSIQKYMHKDAVLLNETGCHNDNNNTAIKIKDIHNDLHLLWVGKFDFRKQLRLALLSIKESKIKDLKLHVVGGSAAEEAPYKALAAELGIAEQCIWHEKIPHADVQKLMQKCDLFFFTSIAEGTPHVVLEAFANELPVLCFDTCGHGDCVDSTVGIKIPLTNPKQSVKEFAEKIGYLYHHREELQRMSEGCKAKQLELSWEKKAEQMVEIYREAVAQHKTMQNQS